MLISVIVPSYNPDLDRLRSVLLGLRSQTLPAAEWETILIDNASSRWPERARLEECAPDNFTLIREPTQGLGVARRRGLTQARADIAVFVDDDNVLAPDYLAAALAILAKHPRVGLAGGKSLPSFASEPAPWLREFFPLLALRDLGETELVSTGLQPEGSAKNQYPAFAPFGAGMVLRRAAWTAWLDATSATFGLSDRRGEELSSGGDNEIVLCAMQAGWDVGYFPQLRLTHLIPPSRLQTKYLSQLNRSIQQSWIQVLAAHNACPWPPLSRPGAALRKLKALITYRPWTSDAARVRWLGTCGHFDGRTMGAPKVRTGFH